VTCSQNKNLTITNKNETLSRQSFLITQTMDSVNSNKIFIFSCIAVDDIWTTCRHGGSAIATRGSEFKKYVMFYYT